MCVSSFRGDKIWDCEKEEILMNSGEVWKRMCDRFIVQKTHNLFSSSFQKLAKFEKWK